MPKVIRAIAIALFASVLSAQLTPEQRLLDFQVLAAIYARRYAPLEWKRDTVQFDLLDLAPWLERARAVKDDLEFLELEAEYGARLQDTHAYVYMNSNFRADLGITLDIYDGKVLIDSINRTRLPAAHGPLAPGPIGVERSQRTYTFRSSFKGAV